MGENGISNTKISLIHLFSIVLFKLKVFWELENEIVVIRGANRLLEIGLQLCHASRNSLTKAAISNDALVFVSVLRI